MGLSELAYLKGEFALAKELSNDVVRLHGDTGRSITGAHGIIWMAEIALATGDTVEARNFLFQAQALTEAAWRFVTGHFLLATAELWLQTGAEEQAVVSSGAQAATGPIKKAVGLAGE